jgi:tellurite resistance protein
MHQLKDSTLCRLRDRLRERGQRPTIAPPGPGLPDATRELLLVTSQYGPLCEAMYLMMAADGVVQNVERDVLKGALREITDDVVRGAHIEAMLDRSAAMLGREGRDARLAAVVSALRDDPVTAEVALVLAAAVALADGVVQTSERALLDAFAAGLGITPDRADALLGELDCDEPSR